uniref:Retrotransposon gag domain-containing protein n=1 Tax=Cannabis sativa TaxID=3483 RepID=A0A803P2L5_CANSA
MSCSTIGGTEGDCIGEVAAGEGSVGDKIGSSASSGDHDGSADPILCCWENPGRDHHGQQRIPSSRNARTGIIFLGADRTRGDNPKGWVYRAERYFLICRLTEPMMLETAIVGLDGDALTWFQWENQRRPINSWETLKHLLLHRFRAVPIGSPSEEFLSITQTSTVRDYRLKWEALASRVPGVPEHILEGSFMKGLKDHIRGSLHILQPMGLAQIMDAAQRIEDGNQLFSTGLPTKHSKLQLSPITPFQQKPIYSYNRVYPHKHTHNQNSHN